MLGLAILLGAHAFASHKKDASKVHLAISTFRHGSRTFMDLSPAQLDTPAGQAQRRAAYVHLHTMPSRYIHTIYARHAQ